MRADQPVLDDVAAGEEGLLRGVDLDHGAACCTWNRVFSRGSVLATAIQMPPVPSRAGKRNIELGPQPPAAFCRIMFLVTFSGGPARRRAR